MSEQEKIEALQCENARLKPFEALADEAAPLISDLGTELAKIAEIIGHSKDDPIPVHESVLKLKEQLTAALARAEAAESELQKIAKPAGHVSLQGAVTICETVEALNARAEAAERKLSEAWNIGATRRLERDNARAERDEAIKAREAAESKVKELEAKIATGKGFVNVNDLQDEPCSRASKYHHWIGDTCGVCGVAYNIWTQRRLQHIEALVKEAS
jgi:DNA repair exonuclease SbcCD ATPase subunit